MKCLTDAWGLHCGELRGWLRQSVGNPAEVEDLFLKALRQGEHSCDLKNARAWLLQVARNTLIDHLRLHHDTVELPDDLAHSVETAETVDQFSTCLPRVLAELSASDRQGITTCDLQGMSQADFASAQGLSLSAAKSRWQRARLRLMAQMSLACQVRPDDAGRVQDFVPRAPIWPWQTLSGPLTRRAYFSFLVDLPHHMPDQSVTRVLDQIEHDLKAARITVIRVRHFRAVQAQAKLGQTTQFVLVRHWAGGLEHRQVVPVHCQDQVKRRVVGMQNLACPQF